MKKLFLIVCFASAALLHAQVGIGTVTPEAQLDIRSTSVTAPANTDGILIPKIEEFPLTFPTSSQDGMMVFATGNGSVGKGFYYWDDSIPDWVPIVAGNGGGDGWYEEGTTTAPNNINDDIYTFGNVAVGKNTANYNLDIFEDTADTAAYINLAGTSATPVYGLTTEITNTGDGNQRGLNIILNTSGAGTHTGSYVTLSGDGSGETRAFVASIGGNGTGIQRGFYANLNNANDGDNFGTLNVLRGNGNGFHYGIQNVLQGAGTSTHYAVRNDISGVGSGAQLGVRTLISNTADGDHYGSLSTLSGTGQGLQFATYNVIDNSGNNTHYGMINQLSGAGTGTHYAIRNELTGVGTGAQEGVSTLISNSNDANHFGLNTRLNGTGSGAHTGAQFSMSGTGTGFHTGIFTGFTEGTGILTGNWIEFGGNVGSSTSNQIANYNSYFAGGNGILAGAYTDIRSSVAGTGNQYGTFLTNSSPGSGTHYGARHTLAGVGTGEQYGVYNAVSNEGNANHIGVRNILSGAGSGAHIGEFNTFSSGSGNLTGSWTEFVGTLGNGNQICAYNSYFSGGNGILAGAYTDIRNSVTGTGSQYGTFTSNDSPGGGAHYGNYNSLSGTGTGTKYGTYNIISAATGGTHYGVYSDAQKVGSYSGYFLGNFGVDIPDNTFFINTTSNRVGIGTITPATAFHLNHPTGIANGLSISNATDADRWHFYVFTSNDLSLYFNGANRGSFDDVSGTYTPISDRNLKTNITKIAPVLEKVKTLEVVDYNFMDQTSTKKYIGFIAQDVEKIFPQLVKKGETTPEGYSPYMLDYTGFGTIAIKAIQEQQTEIEDLKQQLEQQKAELLELKKLLLANNN